MRVPAIPIRILQARRVSHAAQSFPMGARPSPALEPSPVVCGGAPLRAGTRVAERYVLLDPCGAGAMGAVWRARHVDLGATVAIKFLHRDVVASDDARARFAREARLAARLGERSRYVVRVTDYGVLDDVGPFLVMEHLHGEPLVDRLKREGRLPLLLTVQIVSQVCRALSTAHEAGIVHRDVKPANVFLARPHTNMSVYAKLMDFGVAKLVEPRGDDAGPALTRIGAVVGTPAYMSPEQLLAQRVDPRSDLWAVTATVYRMLTGELPFGTGTLHEIGVRIMGSEPRSARAYAPELPPEIDAFFAKGLAKAPEDRFASAGELARALAAVAGIDASAVVPYALHPSPTPGSDPAPSSGFRIATPERVERVERVEPSPTRPEPEVATPALGRTASGMRPVPRRPWWIVSALLVPAATGAALWLTRTSEPTRLDDVHVSPSLRKAAAPEAIASPPAVAAPTPTFAPAAAHGAAPKSLGKPVRKPGKPRP